MKSPSQRHPERVIAQQCKTCLYLHPPNSTSGIFVGWFGECTACLDGGYEGGLGKDIVFDAGREAAIRCGDTGNTGLPLNLPELKPSYTHEAYLARVAKVWDMGRPWNKGLDRVQIR